MNRRTFVAVMLVAGSLSAALLGSRDAVAVVSNADYTAVPAFVSNATTPNIIVVMDNSGSMSNRACESSSCGTLADGSTSTTTTWTNTTRYSGHFDSLRCYTYNTRAADGTCPTSGTPALKTVRAQGAGLSNERADVNYGGGTGANTYVGRIPLADRGSDPATISIGLSASGTPAAPYFCVDNDTTFNSNCGDSYSVRKYELKVGYSSEPTGVIQQIGSKARRWSMPTRRPPMPATCSASTSPHRRG